MSDNPSHPTTNDAGIPVPSDEHSLTVGPNGPILLQDHYLIEQMMLLGRPSPGLAGPTGWSHPLD